jgi:hypothetical protein
MLFVESEDELMAERHPNPERQDRSVEVPGDTDAPDIVDRTGEQMPQQSHDGLEDDDPERHPTRTSTEARDRQ